MNFELLKNVHQLLALTSVSGFVLRWWWLQKGSALSEHNLTRRLPHIIDTAFLFSGIWLMLIVHHYPLVHAWLTVKILALIGYIVLGAIAMRSNRRSLESLLAFIFSVILFAWIVSVARSKNPMGFLAF